MTSLPPLDWPLAVRTSAQTLVPGPELTADERAELVAELRRIGAEALPLAQQTSGLPDAPAVPVRVVGRQAWVAENVDGVQALLRDVADPRPRSEWSLREKVAARATAAQVGLVLGLVAGRIIGQFEPFRDPGALLLVAPNVVATERSLGVDPRDFRTWVCVHEQTHRLQFAAAPWLRDRLRALVAAVADGSDHVRPSAEQRAVLADATALMSVLEGYAEVMMDSVGPDVIPTVDDLRRRFQERRTRGGVEKLIRTLFGIETKYAQYRDGAAFCRAVLARTDQATLNLVYASPDAMPTPSELHDPPAWLARVAGVRTAALGAAAGRSL